MRSPEYVKSEKIESTKGGSKLNEIANRKQMTNDDNSWKSSGGIVNTLK